MRPLLRLICNDTGSSAERTIILLIAGLLPVVAVVAAQNTLRRTDLPAPTGTLVVGRTVVHWVDDSRNEPWSDNPNDRREFNATIWYPGEKPPGDTADYIEDLDKLARVFGQLRSNIARSVHTHSFANAKISAA